MNRRGALFASAALFAGRSSGQTSDWRNWPSKPVRLVVPFPPGGPSDVLGRTLADSLSRRTGQPFIVENKPGALTAVGSEYVMRAPPDGYTLLINAGGPYSLNPHVMTLRYKPMTDVPPLMLLATVQQVLVVSATHKFRNIADLVAWGKANPTRLNFGTVGTGTINHLLGELLLKEANLAAVHAPYPGAPAAINAILGGEVVAAVVDVPPAVPQILAGRVGAIAVFSRTRSPFLPGVPTAREQGFAKAESEGLYGLFTPAKMDPALVRKIRGDVTAAMDDPALHERFKTLSIVPRTSTPEEFRALLETDSNKLGPLAKSMGIRVN